MTSTPAITSIRGSAAGHSGGGCRRPDSATITAVLALALGAVLACGTADTGPDRGDATGMAAGEEDGDDERDQVRRFWRLYRAANDARVEGRRGAAVRGFEAALEIDPDHGDALHYLAQLRLERDEVTRARRLLRRLVASEAASLRGMQQLAVALGIPRAGWAADLEAALETVRRAVEINPENSGPRVLEARLAAYLGDEAVARESEADALERVPNHAEAHALAIWRALAADHLEEVREAVRRALAAACSDPVSAGSRCADHPRLHLLIASLPAEARPRPDDETLAGIRLPALVAPVAPEVSWPAPGLTVRTAPPPTRIASRADVVSVDLDADGEPDLLGLGRPGQPARLATAEALGGGSGIHLLPASGAPREAWAAGAAGAIPWRGAFVDDRQGPALVLVGGGPEGVRVFRPGGDVWRQVRVAGLPAELPGAVLAVADWNGDGASDLFLANLPAPRTKAADGREAEGGAGAALEPGQADMVGRLYVQRAPGRFAASGPSVPGPLQAALAADVDGDGDPDLLVARKLPPEKAAQGQLLLPRSLRGENPERGALALWRNDGSRLVPDPEAVPFVAATVQDLAAADLDGDGLPDLYLATGSLVPEYPEADRLLENRGGRFVDVSHTLGHRRLVGTLRVWARGRGFELLRGGSVPADPRRHLLLAWSGGTEGAG